MSRILIQAEEGSIPQTRGGTYWSLRLKARSLQIDRHALGLALCAVPISIAVSEFFLFIALAARIVRCVRGQTRILLPRVFLVWLAWAGLEILSWSLSPDLRSGWSEIRHLFLIAILFFVLPALKSEVDRQWVWRGIFMTSTLGSLFLLGDFVTRFISYRSEMGTGDEISLLLRSGGLLNHWMIYGTVEILVVAGFLSFWSVYPEERRRWWPVVVINGLAILFSLTRMVWITCFLLVGIELAWRRSKWFWALPLLPVALYLVAPGPVRLRVNESFRSDYYSNAERLQMLRVGWRMIKENPLTGVGPGRVEKLYISYLAPGDPVPAYHGHLHNNLIQLAAQFGLPVAAAALLMVAVMLRNLLKAWRTAVSREAQFGCRAGILALTGFVTSGFFDYTYGHSLALILFAFAVLPALPVSGNLAETPKSFLPSPDL